MNSIVEQIKKHPVVFGVVLFVVLFVLTIIGLRTSGSNSPEQAPEFVAFDGPAVLIDAEGLFNTIGQDYFNAIREDIKGFARIEIPRYTQGDKEVIFTVDSFQKNDTSVSVEGNYKDESEDTVIEVRLLSYGKIATTIRYGDNVTSENTDLPSKNPVDSYIGTMPVKEALFSVDYLPNSQSFYVVFRESVTPDTLEQSRQYFRQKLSENDLSLFNFSAVGFDQEGEVTSIDIVEPIRE